jgi:hypothetical protein
MSVYWSHSDIIWAERGKHNNNNHSNCGNVRSVDYVGHHFGSSGAYNSASVGYEIVQPFRPAPLRYGHVSSRTYIQREREREKTKRYTMQCNKTKTKLDCWHFFILCCKPKEKEQTTHARTRTYVPYTYACICAYTHA